MTIDFKYTIPFVFPFIVAVTMMALITFVGLPLTPMTREFVLFVSIMVGVFGGVAVIVLIDNKAPTLLKIKFGGDA